MLLDYHDDINPTNTAGREKHGNLKGHATDVHISLSINQAHKR